MEKIMNSRRGRILIVEDSVDIRDLIADFYQSEGYEVEVAVDGHDALKKLRARPELPAVILLDLMMPGMDGFTFRQEQRKDPLLATVPVLIMTADANAEIKASKVEAQGYMKKPVTVEGLLAAAERFCGSAD